MSATHFFMRGNMYKQVRFLTDFTHPALGNVWWGRIMMLPIAEAKKQIDLGRAVGIEPKAKKDEARAEAVETIKKARGK